MMDRSKVTEAHERVRGYLAQTRAFFLKLDDPASPAERMERSSWAAEQKGAEEALAALVAQLEMLRAQFEALAAADAEKAVRVAGRSRQPLPRQMSILELIEE